MKQYLQHLARLTALRLIVWKLQRKVDRLRAVMYDICYCDESQCMNCAYFSRLNGQLIKARLELAAERKR